MMSRMASPDSIALAASAENDRTRGGPGRGKRGQSSFLLSHDIRRRPAGARDRLRTLARLLSGPRLRALSSHRQFVRLRFAAAPAEALPVDLMLADSPTFAAIEGGSRRCDIGNGLSFAIPSPLHLIAMKLHALRSPARFENGIDLQDVKHLIKAARIDISSQEFTDIAERYATDAIRTRLLRELSEESSS